MGEETNQAVQTQEASKQETQTEPEKVSFTLEEAREERKRMEEVHKKIKQENDRMEKLMGEAMLEGRGITATKQKHVETEKEYAQKVLRGEI
jgi:hypothetical protein